MNLCKLGTILGVYAAHGVTAFAFLMALWVSGVVDGQLVNQAVGAGQPGYVKAAVCAECHRAIYQTWFDSHHGWAVRRPIAENVLGDFDNATLQHKGIESRFSRRDGKYFVETDGPDGRMTKFQVKYTVGVSPLQQYLVELDRGRLQVLDLAWDVKKQSWYHLYPNQTLSAGNGLHWTGPYKNWQARCAGCHQTNFVKGYDTNNQTYHASWSDLNVACESCHGPGEAHVAWAKNQSKSYEGGLGSMGQKGLTVPFGKQYAETEIQLCAGCHARREPLGADSPVPGEPFADHYSLARLRDGLYHADGQINDEVYVYGSFLQSKMYARGVRCTSCHEPHSLGLVAAENAICTRCHGPLEQPDFQTLKLAKYDAPEHHHHRPGSSGARCVNCHMPAKNYMVIDPRRDHSFRVPRPDLSTKLGTPNACADCHADKSAGWAASQLGQWFPDGRSGRPHYGEAFAAARRGDYSTLTRDKLVAIALDAQSPAIVRASALDLLQHASQGQIAQKVAPLLSDVSDLVRAASARLFRSAPIDVRLSQVAPLVADPRRSVRITAVRELVSVPPNRIPIEDRGKIAAAFGEFRRSLFAKADFPETQMSIAGVALVLRNPRAAEAALKTALSMDPEIADAWLMLSRVQIAQRKIDKARQSLARGIEHLPGIGQLHQALGNILIEQGHDRQALAPLSKAAQLMPRDVGVAIDLATTLTRLKQHIEAATVIESAQNLAPNDPNVLALKATNRLSRGLLVEARDTVRELVRRYPEYRLTAKLRALLELPQ